jgi:hypothetical protein
VVADYRGLGAVAIATRRIYSKTRRQAERNVRQYGVDPRNYCRRGGQ